MPRKKKPPSEWTTEETMKKLFPKKVRDVVEKETKPPEKPQVRRSK
jgi:hypothetical protein